MENFISINKKGKHAVEISVSYFTKGKVVTNSFKTHVKDPQLLFDNAIQDAQVFAATHGGHAAICRKIDSLYINYLDVNCDLVDRMFLLK